MADCRIRFSTIGAALLPLSLLACGSVDNSAANNTSGRVELFSWWTSGGEASALAAAIGIHKQKYPNVNVVNLTGPDSNVAHAQLVQRMQGGNPPDTFQVNIGEDLMYWVKSNGIDATESPLEPIDAYVSKNGFYSLLVDQVTVGGAFYAVPMNVHRINSLFFNKKLFAQLGINEPSEGMTLDQFNQLCVTIKGKGKVPVPLALGNVGRWPLQELVFEDILPGIAGAAYYESFWRGNEHTSDGVIKDTIDEALLLRCGPTKALPCDGGYFNTDADNIDWPAALDMVQKGTAAMSAMGDWAKGYFESKGWTADVDFGVVQFPGKYKVFVYTADSFPLPINDAPSHDLAAQLLQTFASVESQVAFNQIKGSIPARSDIDLTQYPGSFDAMHLRTYQSFHDATQALNTALALSGLLPIGVLTDLRNTLQYSMSQGTSAYIQTYLDKNYATLNR